MKEFWNWLITSSADPHKTAATVRGALMIAGSYVLDTARSLCSLGLEVACLNIDNEWLTAAISLIGDLTIGGLFVVGALVGLFGLGRKVYFGRISSYGSR